LPAAWIGVGTNDLFHDEDLAYARGLRDAGVPCTVNVVRGGYHSFDLIQPWTPVARAFRHTQISALGHALSHPPAHNP
jgi:acetyl esterase/lipase